MNYAAYIEENYLREKRPGKLVLKDGLYNFQVVDRQAGSFLISEIHDDFVVLEDRSSFSVISRVTIPINRFAIQHNIDKDLGG
jgi:hypothetical protein